MSKYYARSGQVARRQNKVKGPECSAPTFNWKIAIGLWVAIVCATVGAVAIWGQSGPVLIPASILGVMLLKHYSVKHSEAIIWGALGVPAVLVGESAFTTGACVVVLAILTISASAYRRHLWNVHHMIVFSTLFSTIYFLVVTPQISIGVWIMRAMVFTVLTAGYSVLLLEIVRGRINHSYLRKE